MKRAISLVLALLLMLAACQAGAAEQNNEADKALKGAIGEKLLEEAALPQDQPYLALYVEYEKTDEYCTTHARATLLYVNGNGRSDNPAAKDLVIELKTEDTLELIEGSGYHVFFDELPCGGQYTFEFDLYCEFPMEKVEKAPEPKLTITVKSSNVGGCEYTCTFDSMTEPRALVWGWETGDTAPNAIQNDIAMIKELFAKSYYNMQPVEVEPYCHYNHKDIWQLMGQLPSLETDHNDVTYVYINAHGPTYGEAYTIFPGFEAFAPDTSVTHAGTTLENKNLVLYNQFFEYMQRTLKGRIVFVFDICYSGQALSRAEGAGFEEGQISLLTSVDEGSQGGAWDKNFFTDGYGWFTKEVYDEFAGRTGAQTIGDVYSFIRRHADTTIQLGPYATINPQFTGNSDTVIFCSDPDAWIEDPEFVVAKESLEVTQNGAVIVTTQIEEINEERIDAFVVRPYVYVPGCSEEADGINSRLADVYGEAQKVIEDYRQTALGEPKDKHWFELTVDNVSTSGSLLFITFNERRFSSGAARSMSWQYALAFDTTTGREVEMTDIIPSEGEAVGALVDLIEEGLKEKYGKDLMTDAHTAAGYAVEKTQVTWSIAEDGVHVVYPSDWIAPRFIGNLEIVLPFDSLKGILDDAYIPQVPVAQGSVEILSGAEEADFGLQGAYTLKTHGSTANVKASVYYGTPSSPYTHTVIFYASALHDQSALLPECPEEEWYAVSFESGGETIERQYN